MVLILCFVLMLTLEKVFWCVKLFGFPFNMNMLLIVVLQSATAKGDFNFLFFPWLLFLNQSQSNYLVHQHLLSSSILKFASELFVRSIDWYKIIFCRVQASGFESQGTGVWREGGEVQASTFESQDKVWSINSKHYKLNDGMDVF